MAVTLANVLIPDEWGKSSDVYFYGGYTAALES